MQMKALGFTVHTCLQTLVQKKKNSINAAAGFSDFSQCCLEL